MGVQKNNNLWGQLQEIGPKYATTIFLISLGIRFLLFATFQPWNPIIEKESVLKSDMLGYHQLGVSLLESHRFAYSTTDQPDTGRTPLYPMFIALTYSLFGYRPWVVILFQLVLDSVASILLLFALSELFSRRIGLIASAFYAFDPFLILYSSTTLYSDSFFVFLLVVAFWCISTTISMMPQRQALLYCGLSSLFLGLATLVKPISQYVFVLYLAYFLIANRKSPRTALIYSAVTLAVFGTILLPWLFRNYHDFGYFSLSSSGSYNLLVLDVAPMEMERRHEDTQTVKTALLAEADKMVQVDGLNPQELNGFQESMYWQSLAKRYIANDVNGFAKSYLLGVTHTFFNLDTNHFQEILGFSTTPLEIKAYPNIIDLVKAFIRIKGLAGILIGTIILLYLCISYAGLIVGLIISWSLYSKPSLFLIVALALYFVILAGAGGLARFKMPSIPFYLAFSGIGISYLAGKISSWRNLRNGLRWNREMGEVNITSSIDPKGSLDELANELILCFKDPSEAKSFGGRRRGTTE